MDKGLPGQIGHEVLRILLLEDRDDDAILVERALRKAGFAYMFDRARGEADFLAKLDPPPHIIVSDYYVPGCDALHALRLVRTRGLDIPFILVSGVIGETRALEAMRLGATDFLLKDRLGRLGSAIRTALELTALRRTAQAVRPRPARTESEFREAFDNAAIGMALTTLDGRWLHVNGAFSGITGYGADELELVDCRSITHPEDVEEDVEALRQLLAGEIGISQRETRYLHKLGHAVWVQVTASLTRNRDGRPLHRVLQVIDITGRRQTEARLARANRARKVMAECSHALAHAVDESQFLQEMCRIAVESGGYLQAYVGLAGDDKRKSVLPVAEAGFEPEYLAKGRRSWSSAGRRKSVMGDVIASGQRFISRDIFSDLKLSRIAERAKSRGYQSIICLPLEIGGRPAGGISIYAREPDSFDSDEIELLEMLACDIAYGIESLRARAALSESEAHFRATFEHAAVGVAHTSTEGAFLQANARLCEMLGYSRAELAAFTTRDLTHPEDRDRQDELRRDLIEGRRSTFSAEKRYIRKDNSEIWVSRTVTLARPAAGAPYLIQVIEDISERKRTEVRLARLMRARRVMAECNHTVIHATDETAMLQSMCRIVVESGGYKMAWVGLPTGEPARPVYAAAHAGFGDDAPMTSADAWSEEGRYRGFMMEVIASGTPHIARDILRDNRYFRRQARAAQHGFQSSIGLPLKSGAAILGALGIYAREADAFDDDEIGLLSDLAADIAYGIDTLRTRVAREQAERATREHERRLKESFEALRVSEETFRATFDQASVGIIVTGLDHRFLQVNERYCEIVGYAREELLRMTVFDVNLPENVPDATSMRGKLIEGRLEPVLREKQLRRKDGTLVWVNLATSLVRGNKGEPMHFVSVIEDINERKLAARRQAMEHSVTRVLAESASIDEARPLLLRIMCETLGWACGAYWQWDGGAELLRCVEIWRSEGEEIARFANVTRDMTNEAPAWQGGSPPGNATGGVVRRVWQSGAPVWFPDVATQADFRRGKAAAMAGLHCAFGFPILAAGQPLGMMEFFGSDIKEPDEVLLQIVRAIGSQIGQFIQRKEAEQALRVSEERYRAQFEESPLPMWVWDDQTLAILSVNQAAIVHYGYSRDEFLGMNVRELWAQDDGARYEENIRNRALGPTLNLQRRHRVRDGRIIDVEVTARRFLRGGRAAWLTLVNDISVRLSAERALQESEEQFRQLANNIPQVFWITDVRQRDTLYLSPAAETLLGYPLQAILKHPRLLVKTVHPDDRSRVYAARQVATAGGYDETYRVVRPDGTIRWVHDRAFPVPDAAGAVYRIAGIAEDITERKLAEERLMHLAHYDVLTSLPNRVLFYDRLRQVLAQAKRNEWTVGVMLIDVDRFKNVNDTLGHAVGDQLLQQVAERLRRSVRAGDTVGRLGGDEFAVVLSNLANSQDGNLVAQKIMASFKDPFRLEGGSEIYVTGSIGITLFPDDSTDQDTLIKNADAAMYRAKDSGRNAYRFYTPEMNARAHDLLSMESSLRRALDRREFLVYYQPKVSVATGAIVGVEALLRWRHPERGLVSPGEFMPVLEETGLIVPVGEWVIEAVCEQIRKWRGVGVDPKSVAINLSARQFGDKDLGATIQRILEERGIAASQIEFEITESSLMANTDESTRALEFLANLGVGLSIDDFGTGYSSLGYLKRFPLDALKIDRSFVRDITTSADDATITRAVISMAHSLGLKVIAEGVETQEQITFLAEHGCDEFQGYYFSRPLPPEECGLWLREGRVLSRPAHGDAPVLADAPAAVLVDDDGR